MKFFNIAVTFGLVAFSSVAMAATPRTYNLIPSSQSLFAASAGEVVLTFLSKDAAYSNDLYLQGTESVILNNQTTNPGTQFSLGIFEAGKTLDFTMFVKNTGFAYYTGDAGRNPDNFMHVAYDITSRQSLNIGFEDLFNGGDKDYDDLVFSLSNVSVGQYITTPMPVPEPETYAMMISGLLLLRAAKRRKA